MCGSRETINHSLCCTLEIWKLTLLISVLNLWSKSHTVSDRAFLISLISVIHCDSDLGLLNSDIIANHISLRVFYGVSDGMTHNFMNQSRVRPLKVVIICPFFISALCTKNSIQTASQRNQCCFGNSVPFPLKVGNLTSITAFRLAFRFSGVGFN